MEFLHVTARVDTASALAAWWTQVTDEDSGESGALLRALFRLVSLVPDVGVHHRGFPVGGGVVLASSQQERANRFGLAWDISNQSERSTRCRLLLFPPPLKSFKDFSYTAVASWLILVT